jgi:hypothetical protein
MLAFWNIGFPFFIIFFIYLLLRVVISKVVFKVYLSISVRVTFQSWMLSCLCSLLLYEYLGHDKWEWIKTLYLVTTLFYTFFSNTHDTRFDFYLKVFSLTKISQDLLCLLENLRFFNVLSKNNVHATLVICISLWRKIFHHGVLV